MCGFKAAPGVHRNCPTKDDERLKLRTGPGAELKKIMSDLAIARKSGCSCGNVERRMNVLGATGCRRHREEILAKLQESYDLYGLTDKLTAAAKTLTTGLIFHINPFKPLESLFDLAIERSEKSP
jgi:hypothetical protein